MWRSIITFMLLATSAHAGFRANSSSDFSHNSQLANYEWEVVAASIDSAMNVRVALRGPVQVAGGANNRVLNTLTRLYPAIRLIPEIAVKDGTYQQQTVGYVFGNTANESFAVSRDSIMTDGPDTSIAVFNFQFEHHDLSAYSYQDSVYVRIEMMVPPAGSYSLNKTETIGAPVYLAISVPDWDRGRSMPMTVECQSGLFYSFRSLRRDGYYRIAFEYWDTGTGDWETLPALGGPYEGTEYGPLISNPPTFVHDFVRLPIASMNTDGRTRFYCWDKDDIVDGPWDGPDISGVCP